MNPLLRLCRYGYPYRVWFALAVVAMLVYAAAHTGRAYLFKPIFDEVLPQRTGLAWVVSAVIGLTVCKGLAEYFSVYLMTGVGERMVRDLRSQLFGRILAQSAGFFARRTTGGLMSRITNDINRIQQVVAQTMGDLLRESAALAGLAGLLLYQDTGLALVCLTGAPVVVYPLIRLGQRVRRTTRRGQEELEHLSHISAEAFAGHRIVKAFAGEQYEQQRFDQASERLYRMNMKVTSSVSALPPLMEWLGAFAVVGVLWYGSREIAAGELTPGGFSLFVGAMLLMYAPIKRLSRVNANIQQALAAAERVFETLDTRSEATDKPGARRLPPLERSIAFQEVSFAYDDAPGEMVLDRVSFEVDAGQVVAVVGLSGAGKTTLVNLVPRFYEVTGGSIAIDGADIRDVTVESLRSQIGIVTQDT
ncbi:MAG: ABC transporter ATP-binding protein, partial [Acidobacteria bacterium]|nr:ABC transporter ATP-binding protein [Acidobacteriota bacterium]